MAILPMLRFWAGGPHPSYYKPTDFRGDVEAFWGWCGAFGESRMHKRKPMVGLILADMTEMMLRDTGNAEPDAQAFQIMVATRGEPLITIASTERFGPRLKVDDLVGWVPLAYSPVLARWHGAIVAQLAPRLTAHGPEVLAYY